MTIFLTSSPTGPLDQSRRVDGLDESNDFVENLRSCWPESARCLMIAASPDDWEMNEEMTAHFAAALKHEALPVACFDLWDGRTGTEIARTLQGYDVIFLGGGHVPTQNRFFQKLGLREKIQDFAGIVIGISAGTMNSADVVYAQPELEGESLDPDYERFLTGLGLTKTMILPHYQMVKDSVLDGRRLFEDITYGDSFGRSFLALPDGSYVMIHDGIETVWGEAYRIADGKIRRKSFNIAIDGPAGAGKSTIAKTVSARLGFIYVDTGAMYRALALYMLRRGIDPQDEEAVSKAVGGASVSICHVDGAQHVMLDGEDVSGLIRTEEVGNTASIVSAWPAVRAHLLSLQRDLAADHDVVMDGRDIGTCILPDADLKIFLTASSRVRAQRRCRELTEKGAACNLEEIEQDIIERDERDRNRAVAPLRQAEDAVLIDSSALDVEEVLAAILQKAGERGLPSRTS